MAKCHPQGGDSWAKRRLRGRAMKPLSSFFSPARLLVSLWIRGAQTSPVAPHAAGDD